VPAQPDYLRFMLRSAIWLVRVVIDSIKAGSAAVLGAV